MKLYVECRLPWWGKPYIAACVIFGMLMRVQPDSEKIAAQVARRARVRIFSK